MTTVPRQTDFQDSVLGIDNDRHEIRVRGTVKHFTPIEFQLLAFLTRRSGKMCGKVEIVDAVLDLGSSDLVKWHINHLRAKIGPGLITTIRGIGYRYDTPEGR